MTDVHKVAPEAAIAFFKKTLPFNELDDDTLHELATHCRIDFFPKGTTLLRAGETEITHLHLIQRGGVRSFITDDEGMVTLKDYRGEGAYIGALGIIRGTRANLNVETVEDTFCFLLPKQVFLDLIANQPTFAQYYLKSFSEKIVSTAYNELRYHKLSRRTNEDLYLFSNTVGDVIKQDPVKIAATASIKEAAAVMAKHRVGSLLIHGPDDENRIDGIITDRDLRSKVVAAGLDFNLHVSEIMSSPVMSVLSQSVCFDVLLKMMDSGVHHLAVERKNRIIGVITSHDIMFLQGNAPYYLFKEIVGQKTIRGLYALAQKIPEVIRNLLKEGGKAGHITRMIALLNDHILSRLLTLLEEELGPPPLPYCWLLMGSEGRREQTFKTDQDNALIYVDPKDDAEAEIAETYFKNFAEQAIEHLVNCGYPLCPGEMMASNPKWRQPYSVWQKYFDSWLDAPDPQELLHATIFFDFRAGFGHTQLAEDLRNHLISQSRRKDIFLLHLARFALSNKVPLSFFRNFIVDKDGEHKNQLDVKHKGIAPFVDFARVLALKYGVKETNTLARLKVLASEDHLAQDVYQATVETYELMMQLRLLHQLHQLEEGTLPDNYIDPAHLTELERRMLKQGFSVLERLHSILETMYPVG